MRSDSARSWAQLPNPTAAVTAGPAAPAAVPEICHWMGMEAKAQSGRIEKRMTAQKDVCLLACVCGCVRVFAQTEDEAYYMYVVCHEIG